MIKEFYVAPQEDALLILWGESDGDVVTDGSRILHPGESFGDHSYEELKERPGKVVLDN